MRKYTIIVESSSPPPLCLGQKLVGDCIVIALQQEDKQLVSASTLALRYGLSAETIRRRCATINRGTHGKHLYDADEANTILAKKEKRRGRKRAV